MNKTLPLRQQKSILARIISIVGSRGILYCQIIIYTCCDHMKMIPSFKHGKLTYGYVYLFNYVQSCMTIII